MKFLAPPAELRVDGALWDGFVASVPAGTFHQLTAWADANRPRGWTAVRVVADPADGPIGAQVLVHAMPPSPWSRGYATRGPLAHRFTPGAIRAFTHELRSTAARRRLTHVFADPELPRGGPEGEAFVTAGWRRVPRVLQVQTRVIDLRRSEAELWGDLSSTGRWSVNKARRMGAAEEEGGAELLPDFARLYRETEARLGPRLAFRANFSDVFAAFAARAAATIVLARDGAGTPLAAVMLLACGDRMFELYDASTREGPIASYANYLVQWEAIRRARERGLLAFDMWGTDEPNLARFKGHFGGEERFYDGAFELVLDRPARLIVSAVQRLRSLRPRPP